MMSSLSLLLSQKSHLTNYNLMKVSEDEQLNETEEEETQEEEATEEETEEEATEEEETEEEEETA